MYKKSSRRAAGGGYPTGGKYSCPETPQPPQSFRSSPKDSQSPPTDTQLISQRKQQAGTQ